MGGYKKGMEESKRREIDQLLDQYEEEFEKSQKDYQWLFVRPDGKMQKGLMLIGEAPGKNEVLEGKPFVGAAGEKLKDFLKILDLKRDDIYITNIIKYRLYRINEKTNNMVNRPARKDEIESSAIYLKKEIEILEPKVIVTLGNVALKGILDNHSVSIGDYHGKRWDYNKSILFPLYHPASLIYNQKLIDEYNKDVLKLKELLVSLR